MLLTRKNLISVLVIGLIRLSVPMSQRPEYLAPASALMTDNVSRRDFLAASFSSMGTLAIAPFAPEIEAIAGAGNVTELPAVINPAAVEGMRMVARLLFSTTSPCGSPEEFKTQVGAVHDAIKSVATHVAPVTPKQVLSWRADVAMAGKRLPEFEQEAEILFNRMRTAQVPDPAILGQKIRRNIILNVGDVPVREQGKIMVQTVEEQHREFGRATREIRQKIDEMDGWLDQMAKRLPCRDAQSEGRSTERRQEEWLVLVPFRTVHSPEPLVRDDLLEVRKMVERDGVTEIRVRRESMGPGQDPIARAMLLARQRAESGWQGTLTMVLGPISNDYGQGINKGWDGWLSDTAASLESVYPRFHANFIVILDGSFRFGDRNDYSYLSIFSAWLKAPARAVMSYPYGSGTSSSEDETDDEEGVTGLLEPRDPFEEMNRFFRLREREPSTAI